MPIEVQCGQCGRKISAPDKFAGKRVKCPKCSATILVETAATTEEAAAGGKKEAAPAGKKEAEAKPAVQPLVAKPLQPKEPKKATQWRVQTEDGETYGPISKDELDAWVQEGRVDSTCQLLQNGWEQWRWAEEVYPELAVGAAAPAVAEDAAKSSAAVAEAKAEEENPFAGIAVGGPKEASAFAGLVDVKKTAGPKPAAAAGQPAVAAVSVGAAADVPGVPPAEIPGGAAAIPPSIPRALGETRPWVFLVSILMFLNGGGMVLVGAIFLAISAISGSLLGMFPAMIVMGIAAAYLYPGYHLYTYAQQIRAYVRGGDVRDLEKAVVAQKSFWKLVGILTLVAMAAGIVLPPLMMAIIGAAVSASQMSPGPGMP